MIHNKSFIVIRNRDYRGYDFRLRNRHKFGNEALFDVAAFLAATSLVPTSIQRKGDRKNSARFPSYFENSAVIFELGDGRSLSWQEQEATAIAFLKEHREELRTLAQFPGVERFELGLRYFSIADPSLIMFCVQASSQLMWHLLDTGCSVMWLITLDRNDPEDDA